MQTCIDEKIRTQPHEKQQFGCWIQHVATATGADKTYVRARKVLSPEPVERAVNFEEPRAKGAWIAHS